MIMVSVLMVHRSLPLPVVNLTSARLETKITRSMLVQSDLTMANRASHGDSARGMRPAVPANLLLQLLNEAGFCSIR